MTSYCQQKRFCSISDQFVEEIVKKWATESLGRSKKQIYQNWKMSVFGSWFEVFWGSNFGSEKLVWLIFYLFFQEMSDLYVFWPKNNPRKQFLLSSWKKNYLISLLITKDWDTSRSSMVDYRNKLAPLFPGLGGEPAGCLTSDRVHS